MSELLSKTGLALCRAASELREVGTMRTISTLSPFPAGRPRSDGARFDRTTHDGAVPQLSLSFFPAWDNELDLPVIYNISVSDFLSSRGGLSWFVDGPGYPVSHLQP